MSRCVILSACPVSPELAKLLRPDDFIIACDAGYRNCTPLGCKPNIKLVSQKGFAEVLLLGALGGKRLEHTLANLCTGLGMEQRGVRVTIQDERSRVSYVLPGETRSYPKEDYFFFSVFPLEGKAEGVCESGSFYELTDAILTATYPLGVSNEYAEGSDCITVSTRTGALVVVETLADGPVC